MKHWNNDVPTSEPDFLRRHILENTRYDWDQSHILHGREPAPGDLVLTSNDYLSISKEPAIIEAEIAVLRDVGHGVPQSRVFSNHRDDVHRTFEKRIADFVGAEDAALTQSGYDANVGLIESIAVKGKPMYIDMFAHASLWKGCQSAGVTPIPFRHNSMRQLEKKITVGGPGTILLDAVYSTHGSLCPLAEAVEIASQNGCVLVVDETHSFGVQGQRGEGFTRSLGLQDRVHFQVIGLSKAFATRGGIVAGSKSSLNFFRDTSFPSIFSTQVMRHEVTGYDAALNVIQAQGQRRADLHARHAQFRDGVASIGYNVSLSDTQIVSIISGTETETIRFRDFIESRGLFGSVYCAPATPKNRALIRFTLNASVTVHDVNRALSILRHAFDDLGAAEWRSTRR